MHITSSIVDVTMSQKTVTERKADSRKLYALALNAEEEFSRHILAATMFFRQVISLIFNDNNYEYKL